MSAEHWRIVVEGICKPLLTPSVGNNAEVYFGPGVDLGHGCSSLTDSFITAAECLPSLTAEQAIAEIKDGLGPLRRTGGLYAVTSTAWIRAILDRIEE